jgi:hypothetical protein
MINLVTILPPRRQSQLTNQSHKTTWAKQLELFLTKAHLLQRTETKQSHEKHARYRQTTHCSKQIN